MDLRDFLEMLDVLFPLVEEPEQTKIHEIELSYELADPEPQLGWS